MKTLTLILTISSLLIASNPFEKKLPFKEAIIEYSVSSSEKGAEILYIKDYGQSRVLYKKTDAKLTQKPKEEFILTTSKWVYQINPKTSIATRTPNFRYLLYINYKELNKEQKKQVLKNLELINYLPITKTHFKIEKNYTKINNIPCDLLIEKEKKCYGFNGSLLLKSEIKILGYKRVELLNDIYETKVDSKLFDIRDYKIIDDKKKSVKLYEKSKKIINFLKKEINPKTIFIKSKKTTDYNQEIQESIKKLNKI